MEREYDVIVIGTGVAGSDVAWHCREAGMRVAITDHQTYGGTCALRGCVPKRVLAGAAEVVARVHDQQGRGLRGEVSIDWAQLLAFERSFTDPVPRRKEERFRRAGIHTWRGFARFAGPNRVAIGDDLFSARYIVIATGAHPRPLDVPGADLVTQSGDFFYLETLPERIVFIGGGYISFEFAHVAARGGAKATILQRSGRVLKGFDHEIVDRLVQASREVGIDVQMNMPLLSVEKTAAGLLVRAGREGEEETFEADIVVHGAGRVPAIEGLDLAAGGVETDRRGIRVNEYLQSVSNPAVYVAGDVNTRGVQLTPVAVRDAHIVVDNILNGNARAADYWGRPERRLHKPAHRVSRAHGRGGEGERDTLHRPRRRPLGALHESGYQPEACRLQTPDRERLPQDPRGPPHRAPRRRGDQHLRSCDQARVDGGRSHAGRDPLGLPEQHLRYHPYGPSTGADVRGRVGVVDHFTCSGDSGAWVRSPPHAEVREATQRVKC
jgi:glutathione reductase (NADPH)